PNYFEVPSCFFFRQWKVYVLPRFRHKTRIVVRCEGEMNKRKLGSFALSALILALGLSAQAQQPGKVWRMGYLSSVSPSSESTRAESIRRALRELGYIEGQNIAIEYRYADEYRYAELKLHRLPELAAELVHLKVDIIVVAGGTIYVQAAKI